MEQSSNERVGANDITECQHHNNCGSFCETRREVQMNLCADCLEAHDEDTGLASELQRLREQVRALEADRDSWKQTAENWIDVADRRDKTNRDMRARLESADKLLTDAVSVLDAEDEDGTPYMMGCCKDIRYAWEWLQPQITTYLQPPKSPAPAEAGDSAENDQTAHWRASPEPIQCSCGVGQLTWTNHGYRCPVYRMEARLVEKSEIGNPKQPTE
jgi:hypothetical protein